MKKAEPCPQCHSVGFHKMSCTEPWEARKRSQATQVPPTPSNGPQRASYEPTEVSQEDYWYLNRGRLRSGHVCELFDGTVVRLDRTVPGDGTQWYVDVWYNGHWSAEDMRIEPSDIKKGPSW